MCIRSGSERRPRPPRFGRRCLVFGRQLLIVLLVLVHAAPLRAHGPGSHSAASSDAARPPTTTFDFDPDDEPLADVRIEGNTTIPVSEIAPHIKSRPGRPVSQKMIKDDVDTLVRTRWFATVEPLLRRNDDGPVLIFRVVERPIVRRVEYQGNKKIKTKVLEGITGLKKGSPYDVSANRECARRIEEHYHEKGFAFATVELTRGNEKDDREIVFQIHEGPKVHVDHIKFDGNQAFSDALLKTKVHTKTRLFWLIGGKYDPSTIPDDIEAVKQYYHNLGYFDVKVEHRLAMSDDKSSITIHYQIDEGIQYQVRKVELTGNNVLSEDELRKGLHVRSGDFFNARKLGKDVEEMRGKYGALGRLFAKVDAVPIFAEEPGIVDLQYRIDEDRVWTVRRHTVHVVGDSSHTKRSVVLNMARIHPGDLADPKKINQTKRRLEGSQLFDTQPGHGPRMEVAKIEQPWGESPLLDIVRGQNMEPLESPQNYIFNNSPQGDPFGNTDIGSMYEPPSWVDIDTYVEEARTGRLMFGVGVNSDAGIVGNIVLSESNFDILRPPTSWNDVVNGTAWRGAGQKFRIEALPGNRVSRYLVDWQDPYFLDTDYNLGVSGFYYNRFFQSWSEERVGGRVRVGRQITDHLGAAFALRLEDVTLYNAVFPRPAILEESLGNNFLSTAQFSLIHDTRDAAFLPGEGHYLEATYEQAFGQYTYPRAQANGMQYFTTYSRPDGGGRHILSLRGEVGWTGQDTPIFERFYAGGFQTFRGFAFRGVSPIDTGVRVGGTWMTLASAEYMFPITADENVRGVVFTDTGTVQNSVSLSDYRVSIGAGLRLTIPAMGPAPIALDWAIPVVKESFDQRRIFSFYVGITR